jgi:hypothetical protein
MRRASQPGNASPVIRWSQGGTHGQEQKEDQQVPQSRRKESPIKASARKIDKPGNTRRRFDQYIAPSTSKISRNQRSPRLLARRFRRNAPRTTRRKSPRLPTHRMANARAPAHSPMGHPRLQPRRQPRLPRFPKRLLGRHRSPAKRLRLGRQRPRVSQRRRIHAQTNPRSKNRSLRQNPPQRRKNNPTRSPTTHRSQRLPPRPTSPTTPPTRRLANAINIKPRRRGESRRARSSAGPLHARSSHKRKRNVIQNPLPRPAERTQIRIFPNRRPQPNHL